MTDREKKKDTAPGFIAGRMTPGDFVGALRERKVALRSRFHGWAKESLLADCIAFAPHANCHMWIDLPLALVADLEVVGQAICDDHRHVEVWLNLQASSDPTSSAFCQLLTGLQDQMLAIASAINELSSGRGPATPDMPLDCWKKWLDCKIWSDKCDTYNELCGHYRHRNPADRMSLDDKCIKDCMDQTGHSRETCKHLCR